MDLRARQLKRLKGSPQRPASPLKKVMRTRLAAKRVPLPIKSKRKKIIIPDYSREIAETNQRMTLLSAALIQQSLKASEQEREEKIRLEGLSRQADVLDEKIISKKLEVDGIHERRVDAQQTLIDFEIEIQGCIQDVGSLNSEYLKLANQIGSAQKDLDKFQEKKKKITDEGISLRVTSKKRVKEIKGLEEDIEKKSFNLASLVGEMTNFQTRLNNVKIYERRVRKYYKEAGINLKI